MTDFICVYFGHDSNNPDKWWNITARGFATAKQAEKHGLFMMPTAGVFGFAVIEEGEDFWELIEDRSMLPPTYSLGCNRLGVFEVQPSAKLVLL